MSSAPPKFCPSTTPQAGSCLLGVKSADGQIQYIRGLPEAPARLINRLRSHPEEGQHVRLAAPCAEGRCAQWKGGRCSVPSEVRSQIHNAGQSALPKCDLRPKCRWFEQEGAGICALCFRVSTVVTSSE